MTPGTVTNLADPQPKIIVLICRGVPYSVIVDEADYGRVLASGPWYIHRKSRKRTEYVRRHLPRRGTSQGLHNFITGLVGLDHINGNGLDNRRANLRLASNSENGQNRRMQVNNTSGYRGVSWHKRIQKWHACIRKDGRLLCLGYFETAEAAGAVAREARGKLHPFANEERCKPLSGRGRV